jgi:predicted Rossmann fold nucleotide-binding protein DprA/Smf involved in DNA uptake
MVSKDSLVLLLLGSHLALPKEADYSSLPLKEWNQLARKIQQSSLGRPEQLLGASASELSASLGIDGAQADRIVHLLDRAEPLLHELERLSSLGINPITRADGQYPDRYRSRLRESAPLVLFTSGETALLGQPGIAVVGSRHLDPAGEQCAAFVGNACGLSGLVLYSGGAKGVDTISMSNALEARGSAAGLLADSLEIAVRKTEYKSALLRGDLCLATPYAPNAGFSVGAAMGRNRLIYCLADYAVVVASDADKGGTWAGATEALKAGWLPVFVLDHPEMPEGNRQLLQTGAASFPHPFPQHYSQLSQWLQDHQIKPEPKATQRSFF